jgi:hypothetical protein
MKKQGKKKGRSGFVSLKQNDTIFLMKKKHAGSLEFRVDSAGHLGLAWSIATRVFTYVKPANTLSQLGSGSTC